MTIVTQGLGSVSNGIVVSFGYGDTYFIVYFDTIDYQASITTLVNLISVLTTVFNQVSQLTKQMELTSTINKQVDYTSELSRQLDYTSQLF